MVVLVAMDSFKGSLTSLQAGEAVREGILSVDPSAQIFVRPLADGGEGTVDALCAGLGGSMVEATVAGPLLAPVQAKYCILGDGRTAVIEMAAAAGLTLVPPVQRNPLYTTTFGVGELIRDAIGRGCRHFIVGIGGSATNDGGTGMLTALGYEFLDGEGRPIPPGAQGLGLLQRISDERVLPELAECTFRVACDVTNPLCGERGCSAVFAPQKGGTPDDIANMDRWLSRYAELAAELSPKADRNHPGAGAAGGLGFAFLTFTNGTLEPGVRIVLEETGLEELIQTADLVVTGEGKLDAQTAMGKAPIGVARLAKRHGKPVIAFAGCVTEDAALCKEQGIDEYYAITPAEQTPEEAMEPQRAYQNVKIRVRDVFRAINRV